MFGYLIYILLIWFRLMCLLVLVIIVNMYLFGLKWLDCWKVGILVLFVLGKVVKFLIVWIMLLLFWRGLRVCWFLIWVFVWCWLYCWCWFCLWLFRWLLVVENFNYCLVFGMLWCCLLLCCCVLFFWVCCWWVCGLIGLLWFGCL